MEQAQAIRARLANLTELRKLVPGSLSVKTRTGIDDERQLFEILPSFENAGIDFLVVHPRTVQQKYKGTANHQLTAEIVDRVPRVQTLGQLANDQPGRFAQGPEENSGRLGLISGFIRESSSLVDRVREGRILSGSGL